MKYELELNTDKQSLKKIQALIEKLHDILLIQHNDSFNSIEGGASLYYNIKIDVNEKWV